VFRILDEAKVVGSVDRMDFFERDVAKRAERLLEAIEGSEGEDARRI